MQKTDLLSKELKQSNRIRWSKSGTKTGPVIVLFVGIHGNEPAGLKAVDLISDKLNGTSRSFNGSIYAITGNMRALDLGVRYLDTDLNRLWEIFNTDKEVSILNGLNPPKEYQESLEIKKTIETIIEAHQESASEFIFADLHTTSAQSCAFILINDTLDNREMAGNFPVPQVLGIEENIHGTLLSFINNLGYKALGFEAGAHEDKLSIERSEAFLWLLVHHSKLYELSRKEIQSFEKKLHAHPGVPETYYDIQYHKFVEDPDFFEMISGFENFDVIDKGTALAYEEGLLIRAPVKGRIFMPLYQKEGHDGFLIIREVPKFWLKVSAFLRKTILHNYLEYLPGVSVNDNRSYKVNPTIARFFVKELFHLLGYRVSKKDENTLICYRR